MTEKKRGGYRGGIKPRLPQDKKRKPVTVTLPPELIERIKQRGGLTEIIEKSVIRYLDQ